MANPFSLEGKNAWITGASYGIGFNIAKAFVEAGAKMIIFNDINEAAPCSSWLVLPLAWTTSRLLA